MAAVVGALTASTNGLMTLARSERSRDFDSRMKAAKWRGERVAEDVRYLMQGLECRYCLRLAGE